METPGQTMLSQEHYQQKSALEYFLNLHVQVTSKPILLILLSTHIVIYIGFIRGDPNSGKVRIRANFQHWILLFSN